MKQDLSNKRILLTGATGGIGSELALLLAAKGAKLGLVGRNMTKLEKLVDKVEQDGGMAKAMQADISKPEECTHVVQLMEKNFGGTDILVNNAGAMGFTEFSGQSVDSLQSITNTNILAPMLLSQAVLPEMLARQSGQIVNIGSIFGSIGFAYYTAYSTSKFALRGFSESLRRELGETDIQITYIAPRAVKTSMNRDAVYELAEKVKMKFDAPSKVASKIVNAILEKKRDVYLGFPESIFVRLNAIMPRLVDKALRKQNRITQDYARSHNS